MFYARQTGGGGTLTVFMCYGVNIWCVRESPDLCSVGMFVSDKTVFMYCTQTLVCGSSLFLNKALWNFKEDDG